MLHIVLLMRDVCLMNDSACPCFVAAEVEFLDPIPCGGKHPIRDAEDRYQSIHRSSMKYPLKRVRLREIHFHAFCVPPKAKSAAFPRNQ
jgi:hypothetical protein